MSQSPSLLDLPNELLLSLAGYIPTGRDIAVYFKWEGLAQVLVEHGADVRKRWPVVGVAPIHTASYQGLTETVQVLLDKDKGLLEYRDAAFQTPLYHAIRGRPGDG
ncbi:hypothetical protein VTN00DRAFT_10113 [Thermoascus crustaceus]|uniref:uncharacterized protein n=1 Tax=Thermoascus crustaceus TaxID=5088 RepID=UPI003742E66E